MRLVPLGGLAAAVALVAVVPVHDRAGAGDDRATPLVPPRTVRVDVSTRGAQADGAIRGATLSGDGRYVAFASSASTLVPGDENGVSDVFVHDLATSQTLRVSVSNDGTEGDGASLMPSISADGQTVAFPSLATNLVRGDRDGKRDIFVYSLSTGRTRRVSVGYRGEPNGPSFAAFVSGDARVVAFSSEASNLVPGDRNGAMDVFVAQVGTSRVRRVSLGWGREPAGRSEASGISGDGSVVAFRSFAANLVPGDSNNHADVFVRDRLGGVTERVNVSSTGEQANDVTFRGTLSGDTRFVGFRSRASNLVPHDTNRALDSFVHDRVTGRTLRVSVATDGGQAAPSGFSRHDCQNLLVSRPFLSADGRYAAFSSRASNLVAGDRNGVSDVFVHDLLTSRTFRVSLAPDGREANGASFVSGISADGKVVAFTSLATNLVPHDTNGRRDIFVRRVG